MQFSDLINGFTMFATTLFNCFEQYFQLLFNDLPKLFGLSLGWWLLGTSLFMWLLRGILNG